MIADLVVNHTSDQHPWFQSARADRDSPFRDFYVWSDEKPEEKPGDVVVPRQGGLQLGVGRAGRPVLPAPLLLPPARPQRGQPGGARRDRAGHGLLDRAGPVRVPHRRRALPARADGHARGCAGRPARAAARPARVHRAAPRRGHAARRGQPRAGRGTQVLRRRGRRRAAHALRLRRHAGDVPGPRPRRGRAAADRAGAGARRSRPTASGGGSCATTTS